MITSFSRKEKKYLLSYGVFEQLLADLLAHMDYDAYCGEGKFYTVSNIYYDNANHNLIRKSLLSLPYKEKVRLRSYQREMNDESLICLEVKRKINKVVNKRRVLFTLKELEEYLQTKKLPNNFGNHEKQIIKEIEYIIDSEEAIPKIFLGYERLALFDKENKNIRLTFDRNIIFREEDISFRKNLTGARLLDSNSILMEIKVDSAIPLYLAKLLSKYKIYSTSFSKYGKYYEQSLGGKK